MPMMKEVELRGTQKPKPCNPVELPVLHSQLAQGRLTELGPGIVMLIS